MEINSPIRISNYDEPKKISEVTDRNFMSVWQLLTRIIGRLSTLENKNYIEATSFSDQTLTIRVNGKNYKLKTEA